MQRWRGQDDIDRLVDYQLAVGIRRGEYTEPDASLGDFWGWFRRQAAQACAVLDKMGFWE